MKEAKFSKKKHSKISCKHHEKAHDPIRAEKRMQQEIQQSTTLHPNAKNLNK